MGVGSSRYVHHVSEALRRAFADRARYLGDPGQVADMPVQRLVSKEYAAALRKTIHEDRASASSPERFEWPAESTETTHLSVVDADRNAVALTYTLEDGYGSKIVVPGAGFLLNNEMGDFNAGPGLTDASGLIGTPPNLAAPRKRMLSSMTPTIVAREGQLELVTGSPGGRTIPSTVLLTVLNVVDFGMNAQEAVDAAALQPPVAARPDPGREERLLGRHDRGAGGARPQLTEIDSQGVVEAILVNGATGCSRAAAIAGPRTGPRSGGSGRGQRGLRGAFREGKQNRNGKRYGNGDG